MKIYLIYKINIYKNYIEINFIFNYIVFIIIILILWFTFILIFKHFLVTLISIEIYIITLNYILFKELIYLNLRIYIYIYIIVIIVCERVLGLRLIVVFVRLEGNDYLKILTLIKW